VAGDNIEVPKKVALLLVGALLFVHDTASQKFFSNSSFRKPCPAIICPREKAKTPKLNKIHSIHRMAPLVCSYRKAVSVVQSSTSSNLFPPPSSLFSFLVPILRLSLYNHLGYACTPKRLAPLELLVLEPCKCVEDTRNQQKHSGCDQARCIAYEAGPLYDAHDEVDGGAHVVGMEFADEVIKRCRGRADAEEERDLEEDDEERGHSVQSLVRGSREGASETYKHMTLQTMMMSKWKMLAMPSAKQRNTQITPVLEGVSVYASYSCSVVAVML